jgi:hypothetical protein
MTDSVTPSPFYPADNPAVTTHINLLQGIITRLANNSASCKTWCLTLVSALLSLAGSIHNPALVKIALVPVVVFGFIDTRYLSQERAYRKLYKAIAGKLRRQDKDTYTRGEDLFKAEATTTYWGTFCAFWSWSIFPIYLGLIVAYFAADHWGVLTALATIPKPP